MRILLEIVGALAVSGIFIAGVVIVITELKKLTKKDKSS